MQLAENIISQADAARLRGVSRERINQLVKAKRLRVATTPEGEPLKGMVYSEDVLNLTEGKRGRPRLTDEERAARNPHGFKVGQTVIWRHTPRDGYGFSILIPATVAKVGGKRISLSFVPVVASDNGQASNTAWAKPEAVYALDDLGNVDALATRGENGSHAAEDKPCDGQHDWDY